MIDLQFIMLRAKSLGHQACVGQFIIAAHIEPNRKGLNRPAGMPFHQCHNRTGIDPTAQEGAHRHIRDHPAADGIIK